MRAIIAPNRIMRRQCALYIVSICAIVGFIGTFGLLKHYHLQAEQHISVDLVVMPFCPYGREALKSILPMRNQLFPGAELRIKFIARKLADLPKSTADFESLHGSGEVEAGILAVTIDHLYPNQYLQYLANLCDMGGNWQTAAHQAGIDADLVQDYAQSQQAIDWYSDNISFASARKITLSPTLYVDGKVRPGPVTAEHVRLVFCHEDYASTQLDCSAVPACVDASDCNSVAGELVTCEQRHCQSIREQTVEVKMLSSHQLPKAFLIPSVDRIRQLIPSAQIDEVNIESADGKVLAQRYGVQALPVFFFSESAVHCKNFPFIAKLSTQPYPHEWFVVAQSIVPNPGSVYGTVNVAESGGNVFQFPLDIQAVALQRINHLDDALGAYQKYLSEYPDDPTAIANIGQLFYDRGDKLDAIKSYQRAINLKPDYLLAAENLERACNDINDQVCENFALSREGSILAKQQDWLGSIKKYQAALEIEPGAASTHFRLGAAYMNIGQLDNAVRHLERARELDPSHVEIITMLGKTLWNQGEREDAIKALDNAIALKPMDIVARSELASALEQMDRMDDAIAILQGETSVSNPNPVIAKKLLTLLEVQKRNAEAAQIGHGFMTHSILASDRELWYLIAHAEFACGDRASAVADIKNCSLESSTDPSLAESIGEEFVKMGMLADAQAAFDFVVTHTPANSLAHANLALIHYSTDKEGAAAAAERDLAQQFGLSSEQWRSLRESFLQSNPGNETLVPTAISSK